MGVRRATGRGYAEWFDALDAWGAPGRPYREIAEWLTGTHGLSDWWAQKLIVEYEEARGLRPPGIRRDGTFEVGATKTVAVPVSRLFAAFVDTNLRERWLPGAAMRQGATQPDRSVRFDWERRIERVVASFAAIGDAKSQVAVQHERLPDAKAAAEMKAFWRERVAALKALLERRSVMPDLNYLAIAVAAVAVFVVSTVYYIAFTDRLKRLSAAYADADARPAAWRVVIEVVRSLVVGTVVAGLVSLIGVADLVGAVQLALALWIGFPVVLLTGSVIWEKVPPMLAAIHAGDWLLKLLVIAVIVTLWR